jgi:putative oxidoreductase
MTNEKARESIVSALLFGTSSRGVWLVDLLLLGARLYAGVAIASAGFDKLPTPDWMTDQVAQIGFPAPALFATIACLTEFIAGVMLALGFLTRPMALLLAFTMGVASFGFHRLTPILDMHIAQGFVWLFVVFVAVGGGRLSLDAIVRGLGRTSPRAAKRAGLIGVPFLLAVSGYGLYREFFFTPPPQTEAETATIESVSIAGTFNDWDLASTPMSKDGDAWAATVTFEQPGPVQFKFAANGSWDVALGSASTAPMTVPATATGDPSGGNIVVIIPEAGDYRFELNAETFAFTISAAAEE